MRILADEAALRKAFTGRDDIVWHDGMTSMLGRTYRVWQMWGADAVGVRSPDGSQDLQRPVAWAQTQKCERRWGSAHS